MTRRYAFMAGLPRSGSNLLAALLNQHPEVYAGPHNNVLDVMFDLARDIPDEESWRLGIRRDAYKRVVGGVFDSYYADRPEPVVVDKNRMHGTPNALELVSNFLTEDIRIVAPVRPLLEVLASFLHAMGEEPVTEIDQRIMADPWPSSFYRKVDDVRCDWLMQPYGLIDTSILSLSQAFGPHSAKFHLVEYRELCTDPQGVVGRVFDFLGVERVGLDLSDIRPVEDYDTSFLGIPGMHEVRPTVGFQSPRVEDVLPDYAVSRYGPADFWSPVLSGGAW